MPVPVPTLRHVLATCPPNPHLVFSSSNILFHTANGRINQTDAQKGRSKTISAEASRSLVSIQYANEHLLTIDDASRAYLHALPSGRVTARLSLSFNAVSAALSSDAKLAAFVGERVEIWHVPSTPTPEFAAWRRLYRFPTKASCVSWSADASRLAVGSGRNAIVYTLAQREQGVNVKPLELHGHRKPIMAVFFVGERGLLTISSDGVMFCWRLRFDDKEPEYEKQQLPFAEGTRNPKRRFFKVPVAAKLASRHFVKRAGAVSIRCAHVREGMLVVGMANGVFAMFQLPEHMVSEDEDFDAGLFEIGEMRKRKRAGNTGGEEEQDPLLDDSIPVVAFTDLTDLHTLSVSKTPISRIAFNPTGEWVALATSEGQIVIWDWRSETHVLKQQAHLQNATAAAFSPDGRMVATGGRDGRIKLWGVVSGFCTATFTDHSEAVTDVTFAANDVIISSSLDGSVRAYDSRRYRNFRVMVGPPPRRQFGCVATDEAGELIAAGCVDTFEIIVWSLRTGQVLELLNGHKGPVSGLSFRPRRGTLASSSWDRTVRLWDMYERKGSCEVLEHSKEVLDVSFRPDGEELAACTASGEIMLWNAESGDVAGSVDGARDAAPGRLRESRTVAQEKGFFNSVCYFADGKFIIAGASSKNVCIYHVAEGRRPALIERVAVTKNENFDGVLDRLNSKNVTDGGYDVETIDHDDEEAEDYAEVMRAERKSLPGVNAEEKLRRKKLIKAEVFCVDTCRTGRLWSAVSTEGVHLYGDGEEDEFGEGVFDPKKLDIDITPQAAMAAAKREDYISALLVALRLNDRDCLNIVIESIPVEHVSDVVSMLPIVYFGQIVRLFSWRLEHSPHLELNLIWCKRLLLCSANKARSGVLDPLSINSALRALHLACGQHSKRIRPVADKNEDMLRYLLKICGRKSEEVK